MRHELSFAQNVAPQHSVALKHFPMLKRPFSLTAFLRIALSAVPDILAVTLHGR